jgi:hypothetical protein
MLPEAGLRSSSRKDPLPRAQRQWRKGEEPKEGRISVAGARSDNIEFVQDTLVHYRRGAKGPA